MARVRGAGGGRVSIAGVACYRPGDRPHLFYQLRPYRRRKGEAKGLTWQDYRDLIITAHRSLSAPLVWCRDNLSIRLAPELTQSAAENSGWLRICRLPACAPGLNPAEGIWSLLKRSIANFAAADLDGLVRIVKRKLKKIQYRPHLRMIMQRHARPVSGKPDPDVGSATDRVPEAARQYPYLPRSIWRGS